MPRACRLIVQCARSGGQRGARCNWGFSAEMIQKRNSRLHEIRLSFQRSAPKGHRPCRTRKRARASAPMEYSSFTSIIFLRNRPNCSDRHCKSLSTPVRPSSCSTCAVIPVDIWMRLSLWLVGSCPRMHLWSVSGPVPARMW